MCSDSRNDSAPARKNIQPSIRPRTTPITTAITALPTRSTPNQCPQSASAQAPPAPASATAARTKGKARPSLRPASAVSVKRTSSSSSSSSVGSPTRTSAASTGSVGASRAPTRSAVATGQSKSHQVSAAVAATVRGRGMPRSRHGPAQERSPKRRFSASPAPMRETITQISVTCSTQTRSATGSSSGIGRGSRPDRAPTARNTMGIESGMRRTSLGRTAAASAPSPRAVNTRSAGLTGGTPFRWWW